MPDTEAVHAALTRLVADGTLTPAQATRVADELHAEEPPPSTVAEPARFGELAAYFGGALLLGAAALLGWSTWEDLARPTQIGLAAVVSIGLLVAALAIGRDENATRRRLAGTLAGLGALAAGATAGLIVDGIHGPLIVGLVILAVAVPMYLRLRGVALVLTSWLGGLIALINALDELGADESGPLAWSLALVAYGVCWVVLALTKALPETGAAAGFGGLTAMVGAEIAAASDHLAWLGLLLGAALIAATLLAYSVRRHPDLLLVGVVTTLVVPPTAFARIFDHWMAAVGALLVLGSASLFFGVTHLGKRQPR